MSFGLAKYLPIIVLAACLSAIPQVQAATPAPPNSPSPAAPASIAKPDIAKHYSQAPLSQEPGEALKLVGGKTAGDVALSKTRQRSAKESEHASA